MNWAGNMMVECVGGWDELAARDVLHGLDHPLVAHAVLDGDIGQRRRVPSHRSPAGGSGPSNCSSKASLDHSVSNPNKRR